MIKMTEYQLQCAVKDFADLHLLPMIHVPNEGLRSKYTGFRLKRIGMMAGVSDCFFPRGNESHKGWFLELKIPPNKPTPTQISFIALVKSEGYWGSIAYGVEDAIAQITQFYDL